MRLAALLLMSAIAVAQEAPSEAGADPGQASAGAVVGPQYGLETSSPRGVIASFQRLSAEFEAAMTAYKTAHDRQSADRIALVLDQWLSLIDLSQVPEATRREVGAETATYLLDIFNRVPLPALDTVPDATAFKPGSPAAYAVPDTPFRIVRIADGPRQGEFLFSQHTVNSAPQFYRTVENLPLHTPGPVRSWGSEIRQFTGPMVPVALADAVPEKLKRPVLGTPIWKIVASVLLTAISVLILLAWNRATTHPDWGGRVGERWRLLLSPLAVLLAGLGLRYFLSGQIIVAGTFAAVTYAGLTAVIYLALAWTFWVLLLAIFETAISRSALPEQNFDAHMLRLIARIIGIVGGIVIVAYGAQDIGLPVFSLLAGLGIGGLAIALAIRPTLENLIGGFILYLDRPIRVGDFCTFGDRSGTVESIGIRSTQVRAKDRTMITVPNAQFADMQIVNWAQCDRMLISQTIGLR
ncbi:mechanosensitive ion channel domain-containing protein [Tropicimonas sp. IMCC6043]|uniref:mechanosensitive ion channel family protein n=1 Tax=Tropicimonas sp. IMCC6043 TaxID=2510645 RepID=UPI0013EB174F